MEGEIRMETPSLDDIDPTLFIGLGGAGGQVLGRVHRIFHEEFGDEIDTVGASPLQFLLLDTDDFEKLPPEVRNNLPDREQDFLSLSHFNPQRYASRQLAIPDSDLRRWFDPRALRFLEDGIIRDGASRQRMLGRLCLHYSYREVEQRIRAKLVKASDADVHRKATRIRPEPRPLRVFIIASSCGGTGSAAFLDVACMVNRIARDRGVTPSVEGFVFLPFPFIEANTQMDPALEAFYQHNAWAFFEELNHFLLHPERVPEFVLDLDRPAGRPPRPFDYGRELLRTIYLLDDNIRTVGTLDFPQLYAYTARGIFDLFLAPEEGALQSHYSNVKDKLKDRDRLHGQVKRFATFGYAEYRLQETRLGERLASDAVARVWGHLVSGVDEGGDEAAVAELAECVDTEVRTHLDRCRDWVLPIANAAKRCAEAREAQALQALVSGPPLSVQAELEDRLRELPDVQDLQAELTGRIGRVLERRLAWPHLGVRRELQVLERFAAVVREQARVLREVQKSVPITVDEDVVRSRQELSAKAGRVEAKGRWRLRRAPDAIARHEFAQDLERFYDQLRKGAHQRQEAELRLRLADALDHLAQDGGWLSPRIRALGELVDALQRSAPAGNGATPAWDGIPTIREFPPEEAVRDQAALRFEQVWEKIGPVVEQKQKECWRGYVNASGRSDSEGAARLRSVLRDLWFEEIFKQPELGATGELRNPLQAAAREGTILPLRGLLSMSHPACPVERTGLHVADTISQLRSVIWPWPFTDGERGDVLRCLGIPGEAAVHPAGRRRRVSVLQAWYGFTSRALEGMETLRRSYLERHRASSFPHIHAEWNDRGVGCAADSLARFSDEDLLLAARALALSSQPANGRLATRAEEGAAEAADAGVERGDGALRRQVWLPGVRIVVDPRDTTPFYLVMYDHAGGQTRLRWRDLRPVAGHRDTWEVVYGRQGGTDCQAGASVAVHAPAGIDLESDLGAYLASEVRPRHAQFLAGLARVEREGGEQAKLYVQAYADYLKHLDRLIGDEQARGRDQHLPVLHRLADLLHQHVRGITLDESRPL